MRAQSSSEGQNSSGQPDEKMWKLLWSLNCPNKVKHFLWRFALNSHPLRKNLLLRKMKIGPSCPVCGRYDEDGGHLYFKCKIIRQVWHLLDLEEERDILARMSSAKETVEFIPSTKNEKRLYILAYDDIDVVGREKHHKNRGKQRLAAMIAHAMRMSIAELMKLNCDATFSPTTHSGGWGFVIRDADSDVVTAGEAVWISYLMHSRRR
jgi:hypothetical protein